MDLSSSSDGLLLIANRALKGVVALVPTSWCTLLDDVDVTTAIRLDGGANDSTTSDDARIAEATATDATRLFMGEYCV